MDQAWRLSALYGYGGGNDYNDEPWKDTDAVLPPDPIDVAGQVRVPALRKRCNALGFRALSEAFDLVTAESNAELRRWWNGYGEKRGREEAGRKLRFSNAKYADHLRSFADDMRQENERILQRVRAAELYHCSTYFEVPKTANSSRVIFNGKKLSQHWKVPRPVNICDTGGIIRKILSVSEASKDMYIVVGDFRHWFHQIKVSETLSRHFGIALRNALGGTETFRWRTLPMGWSHSPFIAQALAWGVLCHREDNQRSIFDETAFHGTELPTFVPSASGGFLTVYYDNFTLVTPSLEEAEIFKTRLARNTMTFSVTIKEGSYTSYASTCQSDLTTQWDFLGVTFYRFMSGASFVLEWRPQKRTVWKEGWGERPHPLSCVDSARWLGRCLFFQLMSLRPLSGTKEGRTITRTLSLIGRTAAISGWKSSFAWEHKGLDAVQQIWHRATNENFTWSRATCPEVIDIDLIRVVVATDASTTYGYGYLVMQFDAATGKLSRPASELEISASYKWPTEDDRSIYLKEMEAATQGIKRVCAAFPEERAIMLVCDNTAVCFALRAGFSSNWEACRMMADTMPLMDRIIVVPVKSAENPADCHSRGDYSDCNRRIGFLEVAIQAHRLGRRTDKQTEYQREESGNESLLRHPDENVDNGPGDVLATDLILGWSDLSIDE